MNKKNYLVVIVNYDGISNIFGPFVKNEAHRIARILKDNPMEYDWKYQQMYLDYDAAQEKFGIESKDFSDYLNNAEDIEKQKKIELVGFNFFGDWEARQICIQAPRKDSPEMECACKDFLDFKDEGGMIY